MRLRYQTKAVVYEVISTLDFDSVGIRQQRTLYGSDIRLPNSEIIRRAKENIRKKFEQSNGKLVSVMIKQVYS